MNVEEFLDISHSTKIAEYSLPKIYTAVKVAMRQIASIFL